MLTDQLPDNYNFTDGDISLIQEMETPKHEMNIEERPDFGSEDTPETVQDDLQNADTHEDDGLISAAVEETANIVTDSIDFGAAFGLHLISKNSIDSHKATPEQKSRIRQIIYVYCEQTGGYIPLWLQLIILLVGIYGSQIPAALDQRKINLLEEKNRKLEEEIKKLQLEQKATQLQKQIKEQVTPKQDDTAATE